MHDDHIKTKVLIAGRSYPLKIKPSEEHRVAEVVQRIEECIQDFKANYPQKDAQDYLAMTLLTMGMEDFNTIASSLESDVELSLERMNEWLHKAEE